MGWAAEVQVHRGKSVCHRSHWFSGGEAHTL